MNELLLHVTNNTYIIEDEIIEHIDFEKLYALLESGVSIESLSDEHLIQELLKTSTASSMVNRGRAAHILRTTGTNVLTSIIFAPIGWAVNSGVIPAGEKRAFSKFSGLVTIHAGRIDRRLGNKQTTTKIKGLRKEFSDFASKNKEPDAKQAGDAYGRLISESFAIIVAGYANIMKKHGATPEVISAIKANVLSIKYSSLKGTGVWNRLKSTVTGSVLAGAKPMFTLANHFIILDDKNPALKLKSKAQSLLGKYLK